LTIFNNVLPDNVPDGNKNGSPIPGALKFYDKGGDLYGIAPFYGHI